MLKDRGKSPAGKKFGFVIYYPFQFYFYKTIYQALAPEAEFIIDLCHNYSTQEQQALLEAITALLKTINAPYRVIYPTDYLIHGYLKKFFKMTTLLVSTWEKGCMQHVATTGIKKARCAYGLGKELTMVRPGGRMYDLTLAHGQRDSAHFSLLCPTTIVGLPKFDEWFTGAVAPLPREIEMALDNRKPTILYVPTHGDLSSIDELASPLAELTDRYNIIAKLHYATVWAETNRMEKIRQSGCIITDDSSDVLPLFKSADVVLSDNSSIIFEACLANVPVVVADFWDREYLLNTHRQGRWYAGGRLESLTYPDSLEQVIKHDGSVVTLTHAGDVAMAIDRAILDSDTMKTKRQALASLFTYTDGQCGARAATAIRDCATTTEPLAKPILYYALAPQNFIPTNVVTNSHSLACGLEKDELAQVQCVYVDEPSCEDEQNKQTFFSLVFQQYSPKRLQITVLTNRRALYTKWQAELETKSTTLPVVMISPFCVGDQGSVLRQCLRSSEAGFTLIALSHCVYNQDWITTAVTALEHYTHCGAVTFSAQAVSVIAVRQYHSVPKGILGHTLFRSLYIHAFTVKNFIPAWYEMALKRSVLNRAEWLCEKGQTKTTFIGNWHEYGMADAFAFTDTRSFLAMVRYVGLWSTAWPYRLGFLFGLYRRFVHNQR